MAHLVKIGKQLFYHSGTLSMVNTTYLGMVKIPLPGRHVDIFNVLAFLHVVIFDIVKSLKINDFTRAKIFARFSHALGGLIGKACEKFSHACRFFGCKCLKLLGFTRAKIFARLFARFVFGTPEAVRKIEGEYPLKGVSPNFRTAGTRGSLSGLIIWSFVFLLVGYHLVGGFRFDLTKVEKLAMEVGMSNVKSKDDIFVEEYLVDLNGTQAAIRAGYSERSARTIASRLLAKDNIQEAIANAQFDRMLRTEITQDMVLQELAKLAFSNIQDYTRVNNDGDLIPDFSEVTRDQLAAVSEVTNEVYTEGRGEDGEQAIRTKFKTYDKRSALVDIGKHLGMFVERTENVTTLNVIENEPVSPEEWETQHTSE